MPDWYIMCQAQITTRSEVSSFMRVFNLSLAVCVAASPLLGFVFPGVGAAQSKPNAVSSVDPKNLDRSIKPCEDFYRFANGGWISRNPVPAEYPSWGTPQIL